MNKLHAIGAFCLLAGCASVHSPYDLRDWCAHFGSARLGSVGAQAHERVTCERELSEDLADPTPRILYIPRDVVMSPVILARIVWGFVGRTQPPF